MNLNCKLSLRAKRGNLEAISRYPLQSVIANKAQQSPEGFRNRNARISAAIGAKYTTGITTTNRDFRQNTNQ